MAVHFRQIEPKDHAGTRAVVDAAFAPEPVAAFLDALRADGCLLGEWLAADVSGVVGHIAFSRVRISAAPAGCIDAALLSPLAVRPDRQRRGIGLQLMGFALGALEASGETLFLVLGHPDYYPRAGFRSDLAEKIEGPWSGKPSFMARAPFAPKGRLILPRVIREAP